MQGIKVTEVRSIDGNEIIALVATFTGLITSGNMTEFIDATVTSKAPIVVVLEGGNSEFENLSMSSLGSILSRLRNSNVKTMFNVLERGSSVAKIVKTSLTMFSRSILRATLGIDLKTGDTAEKVYTLVRNHMQQPEEAELVISASKMLLNANTS